MQYNEAKQVEKCMTAVAGQRRAADVIAKFIRVNVTTKKLRMRSAQKAASKTNLLIVVVVGASGAGAPYQQWPPQRAAEQPDMQTHRASYTSR